VIKNITVIGAGTMGHGIAIAFAINGYSVSLYESSNEVRNNVLAKIKNVLSFKAEQKLISATDIPDILSKITLFDNLKEAAKLADYVIESIPEKIELKRSLFTELDSICPKHTIFATNTSSLLLSEMVLGLSEDRKARTLVSHWYNPSYLIPIVEVSYFGDTLAEISQKVYELYLEIGKKPVKVLKDVPGMIANRLLHALAREAYSLIENGVATVGDVDNALKFGPGFRAATTGMLEVSDLGGLDIWLAAGDNIYPHLENSTKSSDMLRQKVKEGKLGLKNGEGFFDYPQEERERTLLEFNKRLATQLFASKNY